jgi:hypothetical protein
VIGAGRFEHDDHCQKLDRHRCVVSAIESGLSCRAAAEQFRLSASSAIRRRTFNGWVGDVAPSIKVATVRRIGPKPMPSGLFSFGGKARHHFGRTAGPFSPTLSKRSSPNCGRVTFGAYQRFGSPNQRTTHVYQRRIKNCAPHG